MVMKVFYTYIVYNKNDSIHGIGVTIDLNRRLRLLNLILKSKDDYCKLVYYEEFTDSGAASKYEDELNELSEKELNQLVEDDNPMLVNLLSE
jgi:predicted GIY-YIG superfamily endonuclease